MGARLTFEIPDSSFRIWYIYSTIRSYSVGNFYKSGQVGPRLLIRIIVLPALFNCNLSGSICSDHYYRLAAPKNKFPNYQQRDN